MNYFQEIDRDPLTVGPYRFITLLMNDANNTKSLNDIACAEHRKLVAEQICSMPIDTYEGACVARRAATEALITLDWQSDDEARNLLIFSTRARNQVGALNPQPRAANFRNVGP